MAGNRDIMNQYQKARIALSEAENLIITIIQIYERFDAANNMQVEQRKVIPRTVLYSDRLHILIGVSKR